MAIFYDSLGDCDMNTINVIAIVLGFVFVMSFIIMAIVQHKNKVKFNPNTKTDDTVSDYAVVLQKRNQLDYSYMAERHYDDYYVTFETDHYGRVELKIPYNTIGLLKEGDRGLLVYEYTKKRNVFKRFDLAR